MISKWNISKVTNISFMFERCISLAKLPDISKWDTTNVKDMGWIFTGCNALVSLPDISKWHSKAIDMSHAFEDCFHIINTFDLNTIDSSTIDENNK